MSKQLYTVKKHGDRPLRLSKEHAEKIGATPIEENVLERPAASASKPEWVAWATAKGVENAQDLTVAQLQAIEA